MQRRFRFLMILSTTLGILAVSAPERFCSAADVSTKAFGDQLDAFIEKAMALNLAPGVAVAVVQGDEVLYQKGHGYADTEAERKTTADTVFYIASSTKSFTGLAAAMMAERNALDLDLPIERHLPGTEFHPQLSTDHITLRSLLTHTHGIGNSGPIAFRCAYSGQHTPELLLELIRYHAPSAQGTEFRYGNIGYNIASLAMDSTLGIGWKDLLEREIFRPLGMQATTGYVSGVPRETLAQPYRADPVGWSRLHYAKADENMHAAGGLVTTAADLARWLEANMTGGKVDGQQLLPRSALELAHQPHAKQDSSFGPFHRTGYGLGWNIGRYEDDVFIHHFGGFSGFHSHIGFLPEHGIGVAVLANSSGLGAIIASSIASYAYDVLRGRSDITSRGGNILAEAERLSKQARQRITADRARRAARPQTLPHPLEAYAGVFESPLLGRVEFKLVGGVLEATMGPLWSQVEVFDGKQDALRVELLGTGSVVRFHFDDDNRATSLTSERQEFVRIGGD